MHRIDITKNQCLFRKCIMNTEFIINVNDFEAKIYMQIGFFNHGDISYPMHKHLFGEIHVFLSGNATLCYNESKTELSTGDVLYMPADIEHKYQNFSKDAKRITFLIDRENNSALPTKSTLPSGFLPLLCYEIEEYVRTGRDGKLKPLLSYICSSFFVSGTKKSLIPITNRELIIEEFFSKKYNSNVTLDDLAKELMLSRKQTEREVKRITGNTFIGELSKRRIDAAILLTQTTSLPLVKISEIVGYSSYCGFYKAYKRIMELKK